MNETKLQDEDREACDWLRGWDTGISSKTIWTVMTGYPVERTDVPYDPSDFGRCCRLLERIPSWKDRLDEVAALYPEWGPLVREWSTLTALYLEELPSGTGPKLYARMKELVDEGRLAAGWERTGPHGWKSPGGKAEVTIDHASVAGFRRALRAQRKARGAS